MDKIAELEQRRKEAALSLQLAQKWMRQAESSLEKAQETVNETQKLVNHFQSEVDELDKEIRRQLAVERNEITA